MEFQPCTDGKRMTKKYYVDAIVMLYFPYAESPKPAQELVQEQSRYCFEQSKIYVMKALNAQGEYRLFKVMKRGKNTITVQELNPYDHTENISVPENKAIKHARWIASEYITCEHGWHEIYACSEYCEVFMRMFYTPGYDVDFDETAYSPDDEANPAVLDDVPENEYSGASAVLTVRDGIDAVRRIRTFPEIHEVLRQYSIEEQNLAYHEHMLERAKKRLSAARNEYEVVKAACMNGNKYLARMLVELKREYRTALERYRMARHKLRKCEAWLAANF